MQVETHVRAGEEPADPDEPYNPYEPPQGRIRIPVG